MIERPDVDALMAGELGQWLQHQAGVRDAAKDKSNTRYCWSAVGLLPLFAFLWFAPIGDFKFYIAFAAGMGALWWSNAPRRKARKETKEGINAAIAHALGIEYEHECDAGLGFGRALAHKMFPSYDRGKYEDRWCGDMAGHAFSLHEAHLEERRGSGKNRRWVTVFRGPIITIGFARSFHGTTLVQRKGRHKKFLFFGESESVRTGSGQLEIVDMVHPDFEDAFTVYSTDQTEARYLVHPAYIERLIALEQAFAGKNIRTLFADNELTIVLSTENMFESGQLDARRDREMVEMCVRQFMAMAELAAGLNEPAR